MTQRTINTKFFVGDFVFLRTDRDNTRGLVREVVITPHGIEYTVCFGTDGPARFYEMELSDEECWNFQDETQE